MTRAKKPRSVFILKAADAARASCLVADIPHSGRDYPDDFRHALSVGDIRLAEDAWLDRVFDFLPEKNIAVLEAQFPRAYVDVNRPDSLTPQRGDLSGVYEPEDNGIIRAVNAPRHAKKIYTRKMPLREAFNRVARYYRPYHAALKKLLDDTQKAQGRVVHLNLHSMPSTTKKGTDVNPFDIILGTRDGQTADKALVEKLKALFEARGYVVGVNIPGYKGQEIVTRSGDPENGRHSIQLEINRRLYMDEETLELSSGLAQLKSDLEKILADFRDYCGVTPPVCRPTPYRR